MLIWPPGSKSWKIVDRLFQAKSPKAQLRFLLRTPLKQADRATSPLTLQETPQDVHGKPITQLPTSPHRSGVTLPSEPLGSSLSQSSKHPPSSILSQSVGSTNIAMAALRTDDPQTSKAAFLKWFNIDFNKLAPPKSSDKQVNFFIEYPPTHEEEYNVLVEFLHAVKTRFYSSAQPKDWDHFAHNMKAGVVLVRPMTTRYP